MASPDLVGSPDAGRAAVRGGVLRVVGYAIGVLLTVGSAAVLFRHLGVDAAGQYVVVLSLVTLCGGVTDAGLSAMGIRELASKGGMEPGTMLRNLLGLRIVFTGVGALLACAYAAAAGFGATLVAGTAIAGLGLLATNVQNALSTVLVAELRLGWVTIVEGIRQAVTAAGIVLLALAGATLLPFFAVAVLAGVVALVLTAVLVSHVPRRPSFEMAVWRSFLGDAVPYALAAAVGAVYFRLAILLVQALTDETQTGYFGASFRVVEVLVLVPQLAVGAAFPIFARAASEDRVRLHYGVQKTLEASALIGGLVAVTLFVGAPFVIDVVAGPAYHGAIPVLRWHAVALSASFVAALFGYVLLSLHRHRAVLVMNLSALLAIGVAGGILIPLYGARGAAAATAVSETVLGLSGAIALARSGEIAALHVWVLPRLLAAAVVAAAVPMVIGLPALPGAILGALIYGALALLARAVPEELLVELRTLRPSRAAGRSTRTSRDGS